MSHLTSFDLIIFSLKWLREIFTLPLVNESILITWVNFIVAYPTPCLCQLLLLWDDTNYLLTKEKAFCWQDGESISRTIFHCGVWYCFTVCVLRPKRKQAQFDKHTKNLVLKFKICRLLMLCGNGVQSSLQFCSVLRWVQSRTATYCWWHQQYVAVPARLSSSPGHSKNVLVSHRLCSFSTNLWLPTSFALHFFQSFDRLLALRMFCRFVCYRGLAVDFHSASPLLGQKFWVDSRQNSSIWNSHPSKELQEAR